MMAEGFWHLLKLVSYLQGCIGRYLLVALQLRLGEKSFCSVFFFFFFFCCWFPNLWPLMQAVEIRICCNWFPFWHKLWIWSLMKITKIFVAAKWGCLPPVRLIESWFPKVVESSFLLVHVVEQKVNYQKIRITTE